MFQFPAFLPHTLCVQVWVTSYDGCRVPPFGYRRIFASLPLPVAFRRSVRPSSVPSGQAFAVRPSLLDLLLRVFRDFFFYCLTLSVFLQLFVIDLLLCLCCYSVFKDRLALLPLRVQPLKTKQETFFRFLLRKEVIHPHVPVGIPCYDLTPVISSTFDGSFLSVMPPASGISDSHGLTGGVYKARERIHRDMLIRDY